VSPRFCPGVQPRFARYFWPKRLVSFDQKVLRGSLPILLFLESVRLEKLATEKSWRRQTVWDPRDPWLRR
jgi:hypothetical protein